MMRRMIAAAAACCLLLTCCPNTLRKNTGTIVLGTGYLEQKMEGQDGSFTQYTLSGAQNYMLYESRAPKAVPKPAEPNPKISVPAKGYCVLVDISDQKVYVYNNDALIRSMTCSSGAGASTPLGTYKIGSRGTWFYSSKYKQGGKYWVGFIGGKFLFHSVPFDKNKNMIQSEAEKLGAPASHGCIRLSIGDSHWFYDMVPRGAMVIIRK